MTSHFTSSVQLRAFVNFLTTILKMFMSPPEGGRNRQLEKNCPHPTTPLDFLKWFRAKGSYMYIPANACLAKLPIHGAMGTRGDTWTKDWRKDPKLSVKTWTLFAVLSEKLSIFTALLIWINLNNKCLLRFFLFNTTWKPTLFYRNCIFLILNDNSAVHYTALRKLSFLFVFVKHRYQIG